MKTNFVLVTLFNNDARPDLGIPCRHTYPIIHIVSANNCFKKTFSTNNLLLQNNKFTCEKKKSSMDGKEVVYTIKNVTKMFCPSWRYFY